jgi:hypothetical protein
MEHLSSHYPKPSKLSEGVRRLSLALGALGSGLCLVWVIYTVAQSECGFAIFLGLQECSLRPQDFGQVAFQRVLVSASFQALTEHQQIEWVHNQLLRQTEIDDRYRLLPADEQRQAVTRLLAAYRPNRLSLATRPVVAACFIIAMGFLVPWGLVRLAAWILEGFRSDRLAQ